MLSSQTVLLALLSSEYTYLRDQGQADMVDPLDNHSYRQWQKSKMLPFYARSPLLVHKLH